MLKEFGEICATCRNSAGYTQEDAERLLGVRVRSLSDYERGKTPIPSDIIVNMMNNYNAPWLGYYYLKMTNDVGREILPDIELRHLSASILDLQVNMMSTNDMQRDIAEVGRDNRVDKNERPIWNSCMDKVRSLIAAGFSVMFAPNEKPPVLAYRR